MGYSVIETVAYLELRYGGNQLLCKSVGYLFMHVQPVDAHAGLAVKTNLIRMKVGLQDCRTI